MHEARGGAGEREHVDDFKVKRIFRARIQLISKIICTLMDILIDWCQLQSNICISNRTLCKTKQASEPQFIVY